MYITGIFFNVLNVRISAIYTFLHIWYVVCYMLLEKSSQ